jgi:hypothetical protein
MTGFAAMQKLIMALCEFCMAAPDGWVAVIFLK